MSEETTIFEPDDSVREFLHWRARKRGAGKPLPSQVKSIAGWLLAAMLGLAAIGNAIHFLLPSTTS